MANYIQFAVGNGVSYVRWRCSYDGTSGTTYNGSSLGKTGFSGGITITDVGLYSNYTNPRFARYDGYVQYLWNDNYISFSSTANKQGSIVAEYKAPVVQTYNVTVSPNGGKFSNGSYSSQTTTVNRNSSYSFKTWIPTRVGYTLLGWSASSSATSITYSWSDSYTVTSSRTWYAVWQINTHKLTLNANGGAFPSSSPYYGNTSYSISRNYNSSTSLSVYSDIVTRANDKVNGYKAYEYEIAGWDTNQNKSWIAGATYQPSSTITMPDKDLTLYAIWERVNCVRYFSNGRLFGDIDTVTYQATYTIRADIPTWGGHVFKGWSVNGGSSSDDVAYQPSGYITNVTGYITLTACWEWETIPPFYWTGTYSGDLDVFQKGRPVENAVTASGWNNLITKIDTLIQRAELSISTSRPSIVSSGTAITASLYNAMRSYIIAVLLQMAIGTAYFPPSVSTGDAITPYHFAFEGTNSLQGAVNHAISVFNNSLN